MPSQRWDLSALLLVVGDAVLWTVGSVLLVGFGGVTSRFGELLTVIAALGTLVIMARSATMRLGRAYMHGYHAAWHDAAHQTTCYPAEGNCEVMDLAEIKLRRDRRLG